jgi:hypothetical protein
VGVKCGVEIGIFKCFRNKTSSLWVVVRAQWLKIDVVSTVHVILDGDIGRKIEVGILS